MTALMTEQVTLTTPVEHGTYGTATIWIAYPMQAADSGDAVDRVARAWGVGTTCTEALRNAAQR